MTDTVYFISSGGHIKIGVTRNIKARLKHIGTHLIEQPVLLGTCAGSLTTERSIHQRLKEFRLHGEWFKDCPAVRAVMTELLAKPTRDWLFVSARAVPQKHVMIKNAHLARLLVLAKSRWPKKTSAMMAAATGASTRACKYWLAGQRTPTADFRDALERALIPPS